MATSYGLKYLNSLCSLFLGIIKSLCLTIHTTLAESLPDLGLFPTETMTGLSDEYT